jgi:hypothetical protein
MQVGTNKRCWPRWNLSRRRFDRRPQASAVSSVTIHWPCTCVSHLWDALSPTIERTLPPSVKEGQLSPRCCFATGLLARRMGWKRRRGPGRHESSHLEVHPRLNEVGWQQGNHVFSSSLRLIDWDRPMQDGLPAPANSKPHVDRHRWTASTITSMNDGESERSEEERPSEPIPGTIQQRFSNGRSIARTLFDLVESGDRP